MMLEEERPDITFEVVQSRGNWETLVRQVTRQFGEERSELSNVILTPNTPDMRPIYARAKVLLALSLWWESFGRVAAEAAMNGIPTIASSSGGLLEACGPWGIKFQLPSEIHQPPYNKTPNDQLMASLATILIRTIRKRVEANKKSHNHINHLKTLTLEYSTERAINALDSIKQN
jgi:glycosyltransferase involved in cell wall biosynthesis